MEKSERDICPPPNQMTTTAALLAFRVLYHTDIYIHILYMQCVLEGFFVYLHWNEHTNVYWKMMIFFADSSFVAATAAAVALAASAVAFSASSFFSCYARSFFYDCWCENFFKLFRIDEIGIAITCMCLCVCVRVCRIRFFSFANCMKHHLMNKITYTKPSFSAFWIDRLFFWFTDEFQTRKCEQ